MKKLLIDEKEIAFKSGMTVLEAAKQAGIYIPTLCYANGLDPDGSCRVCVVEINGRLQTACTAMCEEGMAVFVNGDKAKKARRFVLSMILSSHSKCCDRCNGKSACELKKLGREAGIAADEYKEKVVQQDITDDPYIAFSPGKCVLCRRCIRRCIDINRGSSDELRLNSVQLYSMRPFDMLLRSEKCSGCGKCVDECPAGALYLQKQGKEE